MRIDHHSDLNLQPHREAFEFHGSGSGYFKIWIVNILLSILTLGIYSAWAKVRSRQYFYQNTVFNGAGFDYHGRPLTILASRMLLTVLIALVISAGVIQLSVWYIGLFLLFLVLPWMLWHSFKFEAEMTSYRDIRFGFSGSCSYLYFLLLALPAAILFCAAAIAILAAFSNNPELLEDFESRRLLVPLLVGLAVGAYLGMPYLQKRLLRHYYNRHHFGRDRFKMRLDVSFYYIVFIKISVLVGLMVLLLTGMSTVISFSVDWKSAVEQLRTTPVLAILVAVLTVLCVVFLVWVKAYYDARCRNYAISRLHLQSAASFRSGLSVGRLFSIRISNLLLLIITLGLAWPWVKVRSTRYCLQVVSAQIYGDIDQYVTALLGHQSAQPVASEELFELNLDLRI